MYAIRSYYVLFPITISSIGDLPPGIDAAVRAATILAVTAAIVLIIAANQRKPALKIATVFLDRIPFLNTETWIKRLGELLSGLDVLTRLGDGVILILLSILVWSTSYNFV